MHIAPSSRTLADQAADARTRADMVESEVRELRATIMRETLASRMDLVRSGGSASIEPRMTAGGGSGGYGNATRTWARDQRRARGGSAQSFLTRTTHDALRRDSQDLDRNNPLAQALVSRSADMIGSSFSLQVRSQNGKFNAAAEQFIGDWWSRMDGTGIDVTGRMSGDDLMHDMIRTGWLVEGDRLNLLVQSGDVVGVQMIESERLRNPYNMPDMESADGGGGLLGGVEVDRFGKAVAYHVSDWNPIGGGTFAQVQTRRINAADAIFVRNPLRFRAGQVRGEPALASVIDRFEQLDSVAQQLVADHILLAADDMGGPAQQIGGCDPFLHSVAGPVQFALTHSGEIDDRFTQRLGRNGPGIDADATEHPSAFDDRDGFSQLGGGDGGLLSAWTGPDDDEVELLHGTHDSQVGTVRAITQPDHRRTLRKHLEWLRLSTDPGSSTDRSDGSVARRFLTDRAATFWA